MLEEIAHVVTAVLSSIQLVLGNLLFFLVYAFGPVLVVVGIPSVCLVTLSCYGALVAIRSLRQSKYVRAVLCALLAVTPLLLFAIERSYWRSEADQRAKAREALVRHQMPSPMPTVLIVRDSQFLKKDVAALLQRAPLRTIWVVKGPRDADKHEWVKGGKADCAADREVQGEQALGCLDTTPAFRPPNPIPTGTLELLVDRDSKLLPARPYNMSRRRLELRLTTDDGTKLISYWEQGSVRTLIFPYLAGWLGFVPRTEIYERPDAVGFIASAMR
jgi:hypothetical protein